MPLPTDPSHLSRIHDDAHRLAQRAAYYCDDVEALVAAAVEDVRRGELDLQHVPEVPGDAIAYLREALRGQIRRAVTNVGAARRLCVTALEQQVAARRLASELDDENVSGGPAEIGLMRNAVLVVDDYADTRDAVCALLHQAGFFVRTARNGLEAVIAAYEMCPAVILMDITMPVLDGLEATRLIKAIDVIRDARVIAYTAKPELNDVTSGGLFAAVMQKPAPPNVVVATVQQLASV